VLEIVFNATANSTVGRRNIGVDRTFSGYFDDEAWWGIAWLKAYQVTSEKAYLNRSRAVFDDLVNRSWSEASCGGGFCWQASSNPDDMNACYKNSITNELSITLAAQLALVYKELGMQEAFKYTSGWADRAITWFINSGLLNKSSLVNDGLDTFTKHWQVCSNNGQEAYTYNQGVILSGLAYVWQLQKNRTFLELATKIIESVFASHLVYKGTHILREMDEVPNLPLNDLYSGSPGTDGLQFKSVFIRHLRYFIDVAASHSSATYIIQAAGGSLDRWRLYIEENAESIWSKAACVDDTPLGVGARITMPALFGYRFVGPCSWAFGGPSATTQSAAIDVFVSAYFASWPMYLTLASAVHAAESEASILV